MIIQCFSFFFLRKAGNKRGMVQILNISTGIFPLNGSSQIGAPVTCLTCDGLGKLLWAGDDRVIQSNCIFKQLC